MTTDAQTEARAIADVVHTIEEGEFYRDYDQSVADLSILRDAVTALAAKDAELVAVKAERDAQYDENVNRIAAEGAAIARAERAEAQLAEANKALEPFARFADVGDAATMKSLGMKPDAYHVGDGDTVATGGRHDHESYRKITWADLRAARRAREAQGGE